MRDFEQEIREEFRYLDYAPIVFVSAVTKQRLERLPEMIEDVSMNQNLRVSSAILNDIIMDAVAINPTPTDKGKRRFASFLEEENRHFNTSSRIFQKK